MTTKKGRLKSYTKYKTYLYLPILLATDCNPQKGDLTQTKKTDQATSVVTECVHDAKAQQVEHTPTHTIQALLLKLVEALKEADVTEKENIAKEIQHILLAIKRPQDPPQGASAPMATTQSTPVTSPYASSYSSVPSIGSCSGSYANSGSTASISPISTASISPTSLVSTPLNPEPNPAPPAGPVQTNIDLIKNFITQINSLSESEQKKAIETLTQVLSLSPSGNGAANQGPPPPTPVRGAIPPPPPPPPSEAKPTGTRVNSALQLQQLQQEEEKKQKIATLKTVLERIDAAITTDDANLMYDITILGNNLLSQSTINDIFTYYLKLKTVKSNRKIDIELTPKNTLAIYRIYNEAKSKMTLSPEHAVECYKQKSNKANLADEMKCVQMNRTRKIITTIATQVTKGLNQPIKPEIAAIINQIQTYVKTANTETDQRSLNDILVEVQALEKLCK